ncbi:aminopeptidase N [Candidatus Kaiserbacteria bacterium]|nr:aminopeptidase N [Candidatus Kaiserbacteria bacterium]
MAKIYRKDYKPYPFHVPTAHLKFDLGDLGTTVTARWHFVRKPGQAGEPLVLNGKDLVLLALRIDGVDVPRSAYVVSGEQLMIADVPDEFDLSVSTAFSPAANTTGEGLWFVDGEFITQCEAEGFRMMTYAPDRPDVLSVYTTEITAERAAYPVLLSNGNPISLVDTDDGKRTAIWHDPFPKPTYLFALVAGDLSYVEGHHTTSPSGRDVTIRIFAKSEYVESGQCDHALEAVIKSMKWDEEHYGREYDLDLFMIYVSPTFNMGAMENKGLNIFNMKYVLALPETATDSDYEGIDAVIAHEYFHNWSGDRVTVRDWFQLSLKEGFTVFRDQSFSETFRGLSETIDNVKGIRGHQFAEDAGPLAHPIRRDEMDSISNNYTDTVYNKGATVIRMMHTLLGAEGFRKGTDLYFERHDGQACECEDFVKVMEDANGVDLEQFRNWYSYAGTPIVAIRSSYDPEEGSLYMNVKQSCPPTPDQPEKPPFHIPFVIGFVGKNGDMEVTTDSPEEELKTLTLRDPDSFARWDAWNTLAKGLLLQRINGGNDDPADRLADVFASILADESLPLDLKQAMLILPSYNELMNNLQEADPVAVHSIRQGVMDTLADRFRGEFDGLFRRYRTRAGGEVLRDSDSIAKRALANTVLRYLCAGDGSDDVFADKAWGQFQVSRGMTDKLAAFTGLVWNGHKESAWRAYAERAIADFYEQYAKYPNAIDNEASDGASCVRHHDTEQGPLPHHQLYIRQPVAIPRHVGRRIRVCGRLLSEDRSGKSPSSRTDRGVAGRLETVRQAPPEAHDRPTTPPFCGETLPGCRRQGHPSAGRRLTRRSVRLNTIPPPRAGGSFLAFIYPCKARPLYGTIRPHEKGFAPRGLSHRKARTAAAKKTSKK